MKKFKTIVCIMLTTTLLLTACAGSQTEKITQLSDLEGKVVAMMSTPQDPTMVQATFEYLAGVKFKEVNFYETFSTSLAALESNQADAVFSSDIAADFYTSQDESLNYIPMIASEDNTQGQTTSHMALRADDTELLEQVNTALIAMEEDGTLERLKKEFITDLTPDMLTEGKTMPHFEGAPVIRVGLSGDLPPLDYVAADGNPAGYNVELLTLLSEMLQVNIEISVIPTESKFPALTADRIDIFFFHVANANDEMLVSTLEANNNITLTEPYYRFTGMGYLVLK